MLSSSFASIPIATLVLLVALVAAGLVVIAFVLGPLRTSASRGSATLARHTPDAGASGQNPADPGAALRSGTEHATNLAVLRERRREIEALYAGRPADDPERKQALEELTLQAASDLGLADNAAQLRLGHRVGRLPVSLIAGALILSALALYLLAGAPEIVSPEIRAMRSAPPTLDEMADRLRERLAQEPDRADGWQLLGRTELSRGRFPEAIQALQRALALSPQDAGVRVDLADALAQNQGARLDGRPIELIREALSLDPGHPKGLALAGAWAVSQQDFPAALVYWARLLELLPPGSAQARQVEGFMADLRAGRMPGSEPAATAAPAASSAAVPPASASDTPAHAPGVRSGASGADQPQTAPKPASVSAGANTRPGPGPSTVPGPGLAQGPGTGVTTGPSKGPASGLPAAAARATLSGTVDLAPALAERVRAGDTLFIVARQLDESGRPSGPPVALLTARAGELPLRFTLDDSMAMIESARLSSARRVAVVARISRSGEATVRSGDLQGSSRALSPGASGIQIIIDTVVP